MKKAKDATKPNESSSVGLFNSFFAGAMNGNKNFMEIACRATQQQMLDFIIQRLHHTEQALEECKSCKDPLSMAGVQQKWFAETVKDYFEHSSQVGEKMRDTMVEGMALARKSGESFRPVA
jgi:hypothetical protein